MSPIENRWTPELEDKLAELWNSGNSASQVSDLLFKQFDILFTRNSIIGKVRRLSSHRAMREGKASHKPKKVKAKRLAKNPAPEPIIVSESTFDDVWKAAIEYAKDGDEGFDPHADGGDDVVIPDSSRVTLLDLRPGICRFPLGDPLSDDFTFCGSKCEVIHPYCVDHMQLSYVPIQKRKQVAWRARR